MEGGPFLNSVGMVREVSAVLKFWEESISKKQCSVIIGGSAQMLVGNFQIPMEY